MAPDSCGNLTPTAKNLKGGALAKWIHRLCLLDGISDFFMEA